MPNVRESNADTNKNTREDVSMQIHEDLRLLTENDHVSMPSDRDIRSTHFVFCMKMCVECLVQGKIMRNLVKIIIETLLCKKMEI